MIASELRAFLLPCQNVNVSLLATGALFALHSEIFMTTKTTFTSGFAFDCGGDESLPGWVSTRG